ncbi:LysR family transcriptional regulator [Ktedonosporobacter rubrisoli]|uniref:LysR family transcriptional regulator n=1 Tax=Ktedonosporobacter rubrisoli TaxID=2509675 RepID=A0A4P6JQL9_KTERU|nr:LysR family transcriptional regulator [Ktedonosporobacter rubrisoli]QBD77442.1 LysR family transcriptional regulator [Ktedonosporobacter rubrisoli]
MNFSQLQCFVALAETGSFTEAAYAVDLTQSAVSHALAALESELGVTLLERNRKGVVAISNAGQKIIPHVRALLASEAAIEQEARAARGLNVGKLRLGSIESIVSPALLAGVLTSFRTAYPDIEVVLFEGAMHEVGEWIEQSIIDIGFVVLPARGVESTLITTDEMNVLVPYGHRLYDRAAVTLDELYEEGFIMEKTQCMFRLMKRFGFELNKDKPSIRYQASDSATILAMVREGLGITLVPRTMLPKKLEGVVALPLDPPQPLKIGLAVKAQQTALRGTTLFVQTALSWAHEHALLQTVSS